MNAIEQETGQDTFRSGFCALIGRPNVGKSTLLNRLVGQKVAIVTDRPQTTRNRIMGVVTGSGYQVVFLDTPGMHKPQSDLGRYMVSTAQAALENVELVLFMLDASEPPGGGDRFIAQRLQALETPVICVLNKVDLLDPSHWEPRSAAYKKLLPQAELVAISARTGAGVDHLQELITERLPEGPQYFPADAITDQPEQFLVAEMVREQVMAATREEVPYAAAVQVEEMSPRDDGLIYIRATVYVERPSQKGIIIGKGGQMLKNIGRLARQDIEALLGNSVYLDLWVKVNENWRENQQALKRLGYSLDD